MISFKIAHYTTPRHDIIWCIMLNPKSIYLQFHNVPLYLEWAPMEVFKEAAEMETDQKDTADDATVKQKDTDKQVR